MSGLAEALVAFQKEMPLVHKGKTAKAGAYSYTYADLADVTAVALPLLTKHGLSFSARPRLVDQGAYELVGVLRHVSGEHDEGALPIYGNSPQALGSSITYARRYLLGCMTGIVTDDDDDAITAAPDPRTRRQKPPEELPPEPKPEPAGATRGDGPKLSLRMQRKMFALFNQKGVAEERQLAGIRLILNRPDLDSRTAITDAEGERVCAQLRTRPDGNPADTWPEPPEEPT